MSCPVCGRRKGRRECPALGKAICTLCCGTKRLVEIRCPPACPHLATAREHPASVVRQQQERDVARLLPTVRALTERQYQLFFLLHTLIARHRPDGFARLVDADVAAAAAAAAATFETAARGVVYAHRPDSVVAQRLADGIATLIADARQQGATIYDGEAAVVLRAIERGARELAEAADDTAYLRLVSRLLLTGPDQSPDAADPLRAAAPGAGAAGPAEPGRTPNPKPSSGLILP